MLLQLDSLDLVLENLDYTDLLRLGRACKALHAATAADSLWRQQHRKVFGAPPAEAGPARELFKARFVQQARDLRLKRKVQRMQLDSSIMQHQRELHALKQRRQEEERLQRTLAAQLQQLQRAKHAQSAAKQWQLSSVALHVNRMVQAHPVPVEAGMASVQQQLRVSQLESKTILAGIRSRQQRLERDLRLRQAQMG